MVGTQEGRISSGTAVSGKEQTSLDPPAQPISGYKPMTNQVQINAASAVEQLQSRAGGRLDYSPASLQAVEEMLAEAATQSLKPQACEALVELLGCYILEVGFREFGGKWSWYEKGAQPVLIVGEPEFHVAMMSFDKVRGRLSGDVGDNIPFFYAGFSERARSAEPGVRASYV